MFNKIEMDVLLVDVNYVGIVCGLIFDLFCFVVVVFKFYYVEILVVVKVNGCYYDMVLFVVDVVVLLCIVML